MMTTSAVSSPFTPSIPLDLSEKPINLTPNAKTVLEKRYLRKGEDGKPAETIPEMFWRVAYHVALGDEEYATKPKQAGEWCSKQTWETAYKFYELLTSLKFFPNSPTFTGAGTDLGQLAACYVLKIEDDMGKVQDGIFWTLRKAVLIQQTGGGNGFAFSRLRPKGALVKASMGEASGPVSFIKAYDAAFGACRQGGTRRGANMAVLRIDHPDIREFIRCKAVEGDIDNFNVSVGITDAFMVACEKGEKFPLVFDGKVYEWVDARELLQEIATYAHRNGEPGVIYLDAANRTNPVPHIYELEACNPCGEQIMGGDENCCLGSINLAKHVSKDGKIQWDELAKSVRTSTRFLDNVVSVNRYVPVIPELKEAAYRCRRIGLGIMGLADMMYQCGMRYGSPESLCLAADVMRFVAYHCMSESVELSRERGAFPAIKGSIFDSDDFRWEIPTYAPFSIEASADVDDSYMPMLDWAQLRKNIKAYGIRNCSQTTIAPTGTLSTVSGVEGYGCEPVFALAYMRHVVDGDKKLTLPYSSPLFESALIEAGIDEQGRQRIIEQVALSGSCQNIEGVPGHIKRVFVVTEDITPQEHVMMQAALQAFVSNAISKTINLPERATVNDVADAYMLAWKLGCKGITVYRTGSRDKVVLETKQTAQAKESPIVQQQAALPALPATIKPRPQQLHGTTHEVKTPLGNAFVTVNRNGTSGRNPFEVFINVGKAGSDTAAVSEAIGRLISLVLRVPSPISEDERLMLVSEQLQGIGGSRSLGFGPNRVMSLPDGIARALISDISGEPVEALEVSPVAVGALRGDLCPSCGHASLVNEEGCKKCYSCGHSEC